MILKELMNTNINFIMYGKSIHNLNQSAVVNFPLTTITLLLQFSAKKRNQQVLLETKKNIMF